VDVMQNVTFDQIPNLRAQAPHVRFETEEKRFYDYVAYNPGGFDAFADPEIRRALGLAIDVPTMLQVLGAEKYAVPAGGPYSPIFRDLHDPRTAAPLGHDPERARQILESKGWRDTDGDGIRDKNGEPFRFTLITNSGNQRRADATQFIQQQWREIGVDAQLRQAELNTFMKALMEGEYQAALGGWQVGLSADITQLWAEDSPYNITRYRNPEVTALFKKAQQQPTAEAAAPYWRQAAARMAQDQPYTWLYYMDAVDGVNQRVRDMRVNSYGYWLNTWEWWVPQGQQGGERVAAQTPES
jgi:peptide/nickel transport system substrate-binding protein